MGIQPDTDTQASLFSRGRDEKSGGDISSEGRKSGGRGRKRRMMCEERDGEKEDKKKTEETEPGCLTEV